MPSAWAPVDALALHLGHVGEQLQHDVGYESARDAAFVLSRVQLLVQVLLAHVHPRYLHILSATKPPPYQAQTPTATNGDPAPPPLQEGSLYKSRTQQALIEREDDKATREGETDREPRHGKQDDRAQAEHG